jgi:hypothetical protein
VQTWHDVLGTCENLYPANEIVGGGLQGSCHDNSDDSVAQLGGVGRAEQRSSVTALRNSQANVLNFCSIIFKSDAVTMRCNGKGLAV